MRYDTREFLRFTASLITAYFAIRFLEFWWEVGVSMFRNLLTGFIVGSQ